MSFQKHKPTLTYDEMTTVRKNLETHGVDVDNEFVSLSTIGVNTKRRTKKDFTMTYI